MRACLVLSLCLCTVSLCLADPARASIRKDLNVPAEDLSPALQTVANTFELQVLYPTQVAKDLKTHGAVGSLTSDEALTKVLVGTGLSYKYLDSNTVTVFPQASSQAADAAGSKGDQQTSQDKEGSGKKSSQDFRVAQVDQAAARPQVEQQADKENLQKESINEVIVTGSRLPLSTGAQFQPVLTYGRDDLVTSGATTIADFLNTIPDASLASGETDFQQFAGQTTIQLHGLPVGTTLVLLNGRRIETGYSGFFDLSNIPLSAIERVDVLPVGSSATYGSDALGGAVNFVLRDRIDGLDMNGSVNHAADLTDSTANASWGHSWDRGSIAVVGSFQSRGQLLGQDRSLTSQASFPAGAPSFDAVDDCFPGNVYSLVGLNLPGLSAQSAGIPPGLHGRPTTQAFANTAGQINHCSFFSGYSLVPSTHRVGGLLTGQLSFADDHQVFVEVLASHESQTMDTGNLIDLPGGAFGAYTIGASNPFNPFGEPVGISYSYPNIRAPLQTNATFVRPLIGLKGSLSDRWHYEATGLYSRDRSSDVSYAANPLALQTALDSSDSATALNPFESGAPGTAQLLQSLQDSAIRSSSRFDDELLDGEVVVSGSAIDVPSGPLQTAFGGEFEHEIQRTQLGFGGNPLNLERSTYALFTENRVPLLTGPSASRGDERLSVTLAARYDHASDFGGKATWQTGLVLRPAASLVIRGGYGTSYKAPQLQQISSGVASIGVVGGGLVDPFRGGQPVPASVTYITGGNSNLRAETSSSTSLGIAYSGAEGEGLQASISYFDIHVSNYISVPYAQILIDNPSIFPGATIRGGPSAEDLQHGFLGPIEQINGLYFNFGDLRVSGIDADLHYQIKTAAGRFTPSLALANIWRWRSALTPGSPSISYLGQATLTGPGFAPRVKGTLALAWSQGPLSSRLQGRYVGRYLDYQDFAPNSNELGNVWICDLDIRYNLAPQSGSGRGAFGSPYVAIGAINLFDRQPPFSYGALPYDPTQYDIRGRIVYLQVGSKW